MLLEISYKIYLIHFNIIPLLYILTSSQELFICNNPKTILIG
jgi:peptidoglycan/LPS O-acetylase OafA/YrhL